MLEGNKYLWSNFCNETFSTTGNNMIIARKVPFFEVFLFLISGLQQGSFVYIDTAI